MKNPETIAAIEREAIVQLKNINRKSFKARCKNMAKKIMGRASEPKDMLFWPVGMLLMGLTQTSSESVADDSELVELCKEAVKNYYDIWKKKQKGRVTHVDDALAGFSLLKMYELTADSRFLDSAHDIFDFLRMASKDKERSIIYNVSGKDDFILADGAGMTSLFLSYYGYIMNSLGVEDEAKEAYELATTQLINFMNNGCDMRTHLPYHGYSLTRGKLGIIGWGRAVGWIMMGMAGCAMFVPDTNIEKSKIMEWIYDLSNAVISYQRKDGAFSWALPCMEGHVDSSATGMIGWGIKNLYPYIECRSEKLRERIDNMDKALLYMTQTNGCVIESLSPCEDLAVHRQVYNCNAWGQGAALACLKAQ